MDKLAGQWGVTKQQAALYLDFFKALNDGKLDPYEIEKLKGAWNLTNAQVVEYGKKIVAGVTPSDLWPTPGNSARESWVGALAALNAYTAATKDLLARQLQALPAFRPQRFKARRPRLHRASGSKGSDASANAFGQQLHQPGLTKQAQGDGCGNPWQRRHRHQPDDRDDR